MSFVNIVTTQRAEHVQNSCTDAKESKSHTKMGGSSELLRALNAPPLVAATGIVVLSLMPVVEQAILEGKIAWPVVKALNLLSYVLNFVATQQPGRIDGIRQDKKTSRARSKIQKESSRDQADVEIYLAGRRGKTLLAPSGWAFAIWAPIFLGELAFVMASLFLKEKSLEAAVVKQSSGGFVASQVFQALWTASFRPRYRGNAIFISGAMLSAIAYSLSQAHRRIVQLCSLKKMSVVSFLVFVLPIALHFGWTAAAALVNWNGSVAQRIGTPLATAGVGYISAIGATVLGIYLTRTRSAPTVGAVLAWALAACATGMTERLQSTKREEKNRAGVYGARTQRLLCGIGSALLAANSILTFVRIYY
jgi:hypothetical protein